MEKVFNYFKNKKLGFYFGIANVIFAIVLAIVFFATYTGDNGNGQLNLANAAYASAPEVIGIFMLVGAVIQIVALVLPEYRLIEVGALACFCIALIKVIFIIPDILAGLGTGIGYAGGNPGLNIFFLVFALVICGLALAACFIGLIDVNDEDKLMRAKPNMTQFIKIGVCGGVALASVAVGVITASALKKGSGAVEEGIDLMKLYGDKLEAYEFNPDNCIYTQEDNPYAGSNKTTIQNAVKNRNGYYKVYTFEGSTAEGWQGDYSLKKGYLTLWDDGLYSGTSNGSAIQGYWFNRDEFGEECLNLIDSDGNDMICNKLAGSESFYEWSVDMKASYNGGRLIKVQGLRYFPTVAMYIDTGSDSLKYNVDETIDMSNWSFNQVIGALVGEEETPFIKAGAIFDAEHEVKITTPDMSEPGKKEVTAKWGDFEASVEITVVG